MLGMEGIVSAIIPTGAVAVTVTGSSNLADYHWNPSLLERIGGGVSAGMDTGNGESSSVPSSSLVNEYSSGSASYASSFVAPSWSREKKEDGEDRVLPLSYEIRPVMLVNVFALVNTGQHEKLVEELTKHPGITPPAHPLPHTHTHTHTHTLRIVSLQAD